MTREPLAVDSDGKIIEWEEGAEAFAKTSMKITEALMKRVLKLERLEGRLSKVEQRLNTIATRHSDK